MSCVDMPGTPTRTATICGGYDECLRAKKMVEEMISEVIFLASFFCRSILAFSDRILTHTHTNGAV